ncbi:class F sortase [Kribbella steppae]|uniref:class F sortase n=1 Tax=Kribbella steppae TaxID=2512223 RepID=UPI00104A0DBD|nr:class F sortase [Kribbella steppae]
MAVLVAATLLASAGCRYLPTMVRTHDAAVPTVVPTVVPTPVPVRLAVKSVGIDVPVLPVGVATDGQMELPPDPAAIGWYRFGPGPAADQGAVVLGGHLDSKQYGVGPLVRLRKVRTGQVVRISSYDGRTTTYRVDHVREIPKRRLVLADLFDRAGTPRLVIITCGGRYEPDNGGYQQNLVVSATRI